MELASREDEASRLLRRVEAIAIFGATYAHSGNWRDPVVELLGTRTSDPDPFARRTLYPSERDACKAVAELARRGAGEEIRRIDGELGKPSMRMRLVLARNWDARRSRETGNLATAAILDKAKRECRKALEENFKPRIQRLPETLRMPCILPLGTPVWVIDVAQFPARPIGLRNDVVARRDVVEVFDHPVFDVVVRYALAETPGLYAYDTLDRATQVLMAPDDSRAFLVEARARKEMDAVSQCLKEFIGVARPEVDDGSTRPLLLLPAPAADETGIGPREVEDVSGVDSGAAVVEASPVAPDIETGVWEEVVPPRGGLEVVEAPVSATPIPAVGTERGVVSQKFAPRLRAILAEHKVVAQAAPCEDLVVDASGASHEGGDAPVGGASEARDATQQADDPEAPEVAVSLLEGEGGDAGPEAPDAVFADLWSAGDEPGAPDVAVWEPVAVRGDRVSDIALGAVAGALGEFVEKPPLPSAEAEPLEAPGDGFGIDAGIAELVRQRHAPSSEGSVPDVVRDDARDEDVWDGVDEDGASGQTGLRADEGVELEAVAADSGPTRRPGFLSRIFGRRRTAPPVVRREPVIVQPDTLFAGVADAVAEDGGVDVVDLPPPAVAEAAPIAAVPVDDAGTADDYGDALAGLEPVQESAPRRPRMALAADADRFVRDCPELCAFLQVGGTLRLPVGRLQGASFANKALVTVAESNRARSARRRA